jgi:branched-chain amino acid aminotransferase
MIVYLNGQFVPEEQAVVSVFDRSFLLGDGLYETLRALDGNLFRWDQHWRRFEHGARFLKMRIPASSDVLREAASKLILQNKLADCMVRMTLSRGVGVRGYSPKGADKPVIVISCHPPPAMDPRNPVQWRLLVSSSRVPPNDPIAQFKGCSKLHQILARMEADAAGADEALLLNTDGFVAEATGSNLFWMDDEKVCTPPLAAGILPGVTRDAVFEICKGLGIPSREANITVEGLRSADGVFLSLSSWGITECVSLDGHELRRSPVVKKIRDVYEELLRRETAA